MRVCVVGAGASGLPAIKTCVEYGLDVVCYEKTADIGGLWNYRPDDKNVGANVMASTVVNTSKEMMAYSDFVPPEDFPNFMHHTKVNEYIKLYADHFDLRKYIQFNTEVDKISQDGSSWVVKLKNGKTEKFDKLMLCTGHHAEPQFAQLRGAESFKGKMMHAHEYRDPKPFEGKDVFLLGIGNSALDIAVDIAKIAKSVTISTRRGTWVFNRVSIGGMPYDTIYQTRYYDWIMDTIPWTVANDFMEHRLQQRMDHDMYGLRPNHRFFQQHPTVNDSLANLIAAGYITITDDIECLESDGVVVKGGRKFACDVFVSCTGYTFGFPYMDSQLTSFKNHEVPLYKYVFHPDCDSLAIIGLIQPIGSIAPISEMQCRWAIEVFSGKQNLPLKDEMHNDICLKRKLMDKRYFKSNKHTIQVDYIKYMDELSQLIGCHPQPLDYLFKDPKFALRLFMGANVPYVYRLKGPHSWSEAYEMIRTVPGRVKKPLKNRECRMRKHKRRGTIDEYFRYASRKWIAGWSVLFFSLALFAASSTGAISIVNFSICTLFFLVLMTFMFLWFELQYDMSTVL